MSSINKNIPCTVASVIFYSMQIKIVNILSSSCKYHEKKTLIHLNVLIWKICTFQSRVDKIMKNVMDLIICAKDIYKADNSLKRLS